MPAAWHDRVTVGVQVNDSRVSEIAELLDQSSEAALVGDSARADELLAQARQLDPVGLELELARRAWDNEAGGEEAVQRRRETTARRLGSVAVAAPERIEVWRQLADYLGRLGNHEGVLHATASGLKRDPVNIELWVRRTHAQIEIGRLESAAKSLRHCTKLAPTHDAVEGLIRVHPCCSKCGALLPHAGAEECTNCGADGPARGAPVQSVRARHRSKFDVYFPRVRDVVADALDMPERIKIQLTLDTLLKRHLKRSNEQCEKVLRAMSGEFGPAFDEPLFKSAVIGFLDILIADLIRAVNPQVDRTIATDVRRRIAESKG